MRRLACLAVAIWIFGLSAGSRRAGKPNSGMTKNRTEPKTEIAFDIAYSRTTVALPH